MTPVLLCRYCMTSMLSSRPAKKGSNFCSLPATNSHNPGNWSFQFGWLEAGRGVKRIEVLQAQLSICGLAELFLNIHF